LHEIRIEIGGSRAGAGFFVGNIPRPLLEKKGEICEPANPFNTYAFTPKPLGTRYLLYSDKRGNMFMENEAQQIFELHEDRAPKLIPNKTVLDGILTRKLVCGGDERGNILVYHFLLTYLYFRFFYVIPSVSLQESTSG